MGANECHQNEEFRAMGAFFNEVHHCGAHTSLKARLVCLFGSFLFEETGQPLSSRMPRTVHAVNLVVLRDRPPCRRLSPLRTEEFNIFSVESLRRGPASIPHLRAATVQQTVAERLHKIMAHIFTHPVIDAS